MPSPKITTQSFHKGPAPDKSAFNVKDNVESIISRNMDKNFVQRIKNPKLKLKNPDGSHSTHSMAWGEDDYMALVYPTVVQIPGRPKLARLPAKAAARYAAKTGERIELEHPEEAEYFSTNYKEAMPSLKAKAKSKVKK